MKDLFIGAICFATWLFATVRAWQDQVEWSLRIISILVAIGASVAALLYYHAKRRNLPARPSGQNTGSPS